jgi:4-hydroxybenzoyl-CoA thioesterase
MEKYEAKRHVDWGDCDAAGIIFYPNFFRWMDSVFHEMTGQLGFDQRSLQKDFDIFATPLIDVGCTFISPARYGDRLLIDMTISRLGESGITVKYNFFNGKQAIASGHESRVFVQHSESGMKKTPIPQSLRLRLQEFHE